MQISPWFRAAVRVGACARFPAACPIVARIAALLALLFLPELLPPARPAAAATREDDAAGRLVASVRAGVATVVDADPLRPGAWRIGTRWRGDILEVAVHNEGSAPARIREVVLFDVAHQLPPDTPVHGEGLQMLAQTAGTLSAPEDVGEYPDRSHYRLPEPAGFRRVYSFLTLEPAEGRQWLAGFVSCRRFVGCLDFSPDRLRAVVDCEGIELAPGSSIELEPMLVIAGGARDALMAALAGEVAKFHPRTPYPEPPTGWCSWYCFGPRVTAKDVLDNLEAMKADYPHLEFVQIDDGYQPAMGDWLDTGPGFGGRPVEEILAEIRRQGREPAIWVAPFIASPDARILREHPEWFIRGDDGQPLPSDRVMFGGWRLGPWRVLDATHPEVRAYLERLFREMREKWGVRYFKLDATFWGMMHGGARHDAGRTRVEAYRMGMESIRRGAGTDAYILGCNHPIWPSLGLIDGSRSSLDIERNWRSVSRTGRENLLRGWQNGTLWWNDPDTLVQTGLPENEARFHATLVYATGGAVLAGDDLSRLPRDKVPVVRALSQPTGVAARFADLSLTHGTIELGGGTVHHALLNWSDAPRECTIVLPRRSRLRDRWTGADLGVHEGAYVRTVAARDAALVEVVAAP